MKRKIILTAKGASSTTKVTIEVKTESDFGRDDTARLTT